MKKPLTTLVRACTKLGVSVKFGGVKGATFNKGTVYIPIYLSDIENRGRSATYSLVHEVSHFLMAPTTRRFKKDYGIRGFGIARTPEEKEQEDFEEDQMRFLEICIEQKLGLRNASALAEYEDMCAQNGARWPELVWWLDEKDKFMYAIDLLFSK